MITENKSKSGKIKRILMRKEDDLCEHDIKIKINKTLSFCRNCARIIIQKVKTQILTKFFVKSKFKLFSSNKFKNLKEQKKLL